MLTSFGLGFRNVLIKLFRWSRTEADPWGAVNFSPEIKNEKLECVELSFHLFAQMATSLSAQDIRENLITIALKIPRNVFEMCCWIFKSTKVLFGKFLGNSERECCTTRPARKRKTVSACCCYAFLRLRAAQRARANFLNFQTSSSGRLAAKKTWCSNRENSLMAIFGYDGTPLLRFLEILWAAYDLLERFWRQIHLQKIKVFVYLKHFRELSEVAQLNYYERHLTREASIRLKKFKIESGRKNHKRKLKETRLECQ